MLTDFGPSFLTIERSAGEHAIRWKAPEVIWKVKRVVPHAQSDLYSFGMCVVEAVTMDISCQTQWRSFTWLARMFASAEGKRLQLSDKIEVICAFAEERFQERLDTMREAE
ncbi:hypothetical protein PRIC2_012190 [Phytophthora ramorum]